MTEITSPWSLAIEIGDTFTRGITYIKKNNNIVCSRLTTKHNSPFGTAVELLDLISKENMLDISMLEILSINFVFDIKNKPSTSKSGLFISKGMLGKIPPVFIEYLSQKFQIFEINERIVPQEKVITPLDEKQIIALIPFIKNMGIVSLGICFLNSYGYTINENKAMKILKEYLPDINISLSSEIYPNADENQALYQTVSAVLRRNIIKECLLQFEKQFGNAINEEKFYFFSKEGFLESSKAALGQMYGNSLNYLNLTPGIKHCQSLALKTKINNLITLEIGLSYISISLLSKGVLTSAINNSIPVEFGDLYYYADKSKLELQEITEYLADSLNELTVQQGHDPRDYAIIAFGSVAPFYVAKLAKALKISRVIIPWQPEYFSVAWLLNATIRDFSRKQLIIPFEELSAKMLNAKYLEIENNLFDGLGSREHYDLILSRKLGVKWLGQNKISSISMPSGYLKQADLSLIKRSFLADCKIEGSVIPENIELWLVYIELIREYKKGNYISIDDPKFLNCISTASAAKTSEKMKISSISEMLPYFSWKSLTPQDSVSGPAIIAHDNGMVIICLEMTAILDSMNNLIIKVSD